MARTDAHRPLWVVAKFYEPVHSNGCPYAIHWRYRGLERHDCDLPAEPVRHRRARLTWRGQRGPEHTRCSWEPWWEEFPRRHHLRRTFTHPPAAFVNLVGHSRDRAEVRTDVRRMLAEHRATGEVDHEPNVRQHRHSAVREWC